MVRATQPRQHPIHARNLMEQEPSPALPLGYGAWHMVPTACHQLASAPGCLWAGQCPAPSVPFCLCWLKGSLNENPRRFSQVNPVLHAGTPWGLENKERIACPSQGTSTCVGLHLCVHRNMHIHMRMHVGAAYPSTSRQPCS